MSKWTPGPWRIGTDIRGRNYNANMIQRGPNDYTADTIASVYGIAQNRGLDELSSDPRWERGIANARLIAEAPAMAELLESAVTLIDGDLVGPEWKAACHEFTSNARALLARLEAE